MFIDKALKKLKKNAFGIYKPEGQQEKDTAEQEIKEIKEKAEQIVKVEKPQTKAPVDLSLKSEDLPADSQKPRKPKKPKQKEQSEPKQSMEKQSTQHADHSDKPQKKQTVQDHSNKDQPKAEQPKKEAAPVVEKPKTEKPKAEFTEFNLKDGLYRVLEEMKFTHPTEIQTIAIPTIQDKRDVIGQARTGSGKTAAFVIPALNNLKYNRKVEVVVLVPTRELATQVSRDFETIGKYLDSRVAKIVGGESYSMQKSDIRRGANIVVATPGRLIDHLENGYIQNFEPSLVILDEADEMLDMGFVADIEKILSFAPAERQTLLFSATMPRAVARLANKYLKNPEEIKLNNIKDGHTDIKQIAYCVKPRDRDMALSRIIDSVNFEKLVVFCRTRRDTADVFERLSKEGKRVVTLQGDLSQHDRQRAIAAIKNGAANILIATDVASRGLDIQDLTHVINYHLPENLERYTHRIGRTGRAGAKGTAITIAAAGDLRNCHFFSKLIQEKKMTLEGIPSLTSLRMKKVENLANLISGTSDKGSSKNNRQDAAAVVERLRLELSDDEILVRLCEIMLDSKPFSGPEVFGLSPQEGMDMIGRSGGGGGRDRGRSSYGRGGGGRFGGGGGGYSRGRSRDDRSGGGSGGSRSYGQRADSNRSSEGDGGGRSRSYGQRSDRNNSSSSDGGGRSRSYGQRSDRNNSNSSNGGGRSRSYGQRSGESEGGNRYGGDRRSQGRSGSSSSSEGFKKKRSFSDKKSYN